jgi:4-hydroxybenzoate polyprenyltransferase
VAVTGRLDAAPFLLALGVLCWVAGFDVLYALQDLEFDRRRGLHSLPARFGPRRAVGAARVLHVASVGALFALWFALELSAWYPAGVAVVALALLYEHSLVRPGDLSRLDRAFFDMNAVVSMVYLGAAAAGTLL